MPDDGLTQDFDAHVLFTFAPIPDAPLLANRWARVRRWFLIAFAESWLAVALFRLRRRLRAAGVPALPAVCDVLSRALFRVQIGEHVEAGPGLMLTHGNVVIDGRTRIGRNCQINPWVTIGLSNSKRLGFSVDGPTIGDHVHIGTGAKVLGPVRVGDYARIGANAVVVRDVPAHATVVGAPAHPIGETAQLPGADLVRARITEYRLRRRPLSSVVDAMNDVAGRDQTQRMESVAADIAFLEAAAAAGGDQTRQVIEALEAVERALADT